MTAFASLEEALASAGAASADASVDREGLDRDGFAILRGAIPPARIPQLIERFEDTIVEPDKWPAPREHNVRHAMLDADDEVRAVCLMPEILATLHHIFRARFFLADVQGRDPRPGGGYQALHRDWPACSARAEMVVALAFLDPFGPANGATRLVPGTHRVPGELSDHADFGEAHPQQISAEGGPGDILVFHGHLVHSGWRNRSGAHRRTLQIGYRAWSVRHTHRDVRDHSVLSAGDRYWLGAAP
jgi:hypothetical protein